MLFVGKVGQGSHDQVISAEEFGNLVSRHRDTLLEGEQLLLHEYRLGVLEVQAVVLKLLWFSTHPFH